MLQIAICDDEKSMGEYLKQLIENRLADDKEYRVKVFSSGAELLKNGKDFDIFFLDIHLKDMSGIDMARSLRQESEAVIVFVTALKEYVFDAFDVQAFQYLLKHLFYNLSAALSSIRRFHLLHPPVKHPVYRYLHSMLLCLFNHCTCKHIHF